MLLLAVAGCKCWTSHNSTIFCPCLAPTTVPSVLVRRLLLSIVVLLVVAGVTAPVLLRLVERASADGRASVSTAFAYHGQLNTPSGPANGAYDFRFSLYDASTAGTLVGGPIPVDDLQPS